jgi:hypothetical protein
MAYRKIHDDFWTDPDIEELTPEQKFFYIYLITNPNVNQIGLYEFSIKRACFETGYNKDTIEKLLEMFESMGKIKRSAKTREILVVKFYHHNKSNSPKVQTHVDKLLTEVKDRSLIQYVYSMDTQSQEEEVQEEEIKNISPLILNFSNLQKMEEPLTIEQGENLIKEYGKKRVEETLMAMENWKPLLKKNKSANLTAQTWMKRDTQTSNVIDGGTF